MPYNLDIRDNVKIWFNKNPSSQDENAFLPYENQLRLIEMRKMNPANRISFVYDSHLLSEPAKAALQQFCNRWQIIPIDVRDLIKNTQFTYREKQLILLYEEEIKRFDSGYGNPAAASNLWRWIGAVYRKGIYTDFDVKVNSKHSLAIIKVDAPLLLNVGSTIIDNSLELPCLNNDVIAVVNEEAARPIIQRIQDSFISAYQSRFTDVKKIPSLFGMNANSIFGDYIEQYLREADDLPILTAFKAGTTFSFLSIMGISKQFKGQSRNPFQIREVALTRTANNAAFCEWYIQENVDKRNNIGSLNLMTAEQKKAWTIADLRAQGTQSMWLKWLLLPTSTYQKIKDRYITLSDEELLTTERELYRFQWLKHVNMCSSGAYRISSVVFNGNGHNLLTTPVEVMQHVAPYALCNPAYHLDKVFLGFGVPLHTSNADAIKIFNSAEIGKTQDISWLAEGQKAMAEREAYIQERKNSGLATELARTRQEIDKHVEKVKNDANGLLGNSKFSFYRKTQRQEKITALENAQAHFSDQTFNAKEFKRNANNYSPGVFASLGQSKTGALLNKLKSLSEEATFCYPETDGMITMPTPGQR